MLVSAVQLGYAAPYANSHSVRPASPAAMSKMSSRAASSADELKKACTRCRWRSYAERIAAVAASRLRSHTRASPKFSRNCATRRDSSCVLERRTGALMGDLSMDEFGCVAIASLWLGGTEEQSNLYVLHTCEGVSGAKPVCDGLFLGGWQAARPLVAESRLAEGRFKFYLGSTKWEAGQLEQVARRVRSSNLQRVACGLL